MAQVCTHSTKHGIAGARTLTHALVFTVGCNEMAGNPFWGGGSIASSLMMSIYTLGATSGANFDPAVSGLLGSTKKVDWPKVGAYCGVQLSGWLGAAICGSVPSNNTINSGAAANYTWWQAMLGEFLYAFMCFVMLIFDGSKEKGCASEDKIQYFGFTIGYTINAGGSGPVAISE